MKIKFLFLLFFCLPLFSVNEALSMSPQQKDFRDSPLTIRKTIKQLKKAKEIDLPDEEITLELAGEVYRKLSPQSNRFENLFSTKEELEKYKQQEVLDTLQEMRKQNEEQK